MSAALSREERGAIRAEAAALIEDPEFERSLHIGGMEQDLARFVLDRVPTLLAALDAAHAKDIRRADAIRDALAEVRRAEAERDEARAALAALREQYRDLATYRTTHANLGLCPEGPDDPARDPDCPVCAAVSAVAPDEREALDVEADEARAALAALREGIEEFAAAREQALPGLVRQLRALVAARPAPTVSAADVERITSDEAFDAAWVEADAAAVVYAVARLLGLTVADEGSAA